MSMRIKRGDTVKVIAGKFKGQTGKVVAVEVKNRGVKIEGLNLVKRAQKPSVISPQGGILTLHKPIEVSKVAIAHPTKKDATSRIGFALKKDGRKTRVYKQASNKEIDS